MTIKEREGLLNEAKRAANSNLVETDERFVPTVLTSIATSLVVIADILHEETKIGGSLGGPR